MISEAPSIPLLPSEQGVALGAQSSAGVGIPSQSGSLEMLLLAHQSGRLCAKSGRQVREPQQLTALCAHC